MKKKEQEIRTTIQSIEERYSIMIGKVHEEKARRENVLIKEASPRKSRIK